MVKIRYLLKVGLFLFFMPVMGASCQKEVLPAVIDENPKEDEGEQEDPVNYAKLNQILAKLDQAFDDRLMHWTTSLYDPVTGGFYYAVSARDTEGFAADIETVSQMVSILGMMGVLMPGNPSASIMPTEIKEGIIQFLQERQDPDDGYFYDKQFGKNVSTSKKSRNLSQATGLLKRFGAKIPYPTPAERFSQPRKASLSTTQDPFENEEAFRTWLLGLPWASNPYSAGNTVSASIELIKARGYLGIAQDYMISIQNKTTGLWGADRNFEALNGAMKIASVFNASRPYPYMDEMLESVIYIVGHENATTTAMLWNPLQLIIRAKDSYGGDFTIEQKNVLSKALIKMLDSMVTSLAAFRQPDQGYSWSPSGSSPTSQGARVSLGLKEGDVNGTLLAMLLRRDAYLLAGKTPPNLWASQRSTYWNAIKNIIPPSKDPVDNEVDFDFSGMDLHVSPIGWLVNNTVGTVLVKPDPKDNQNNVLEIMTRSGGKTATNIAIETGEEYESATLELKLFVKDTNNGALFYNSIGAAIQWCIVGSGNAFRLTHRQSDSGVGETIAELEKDRWHDVKIVYTPQMASAQRVRFYVNNALKLESDRYFGIDSGLGVPKNLKTIAFHSFNSGDATMYLDDVKLKLD